MAIPDELDRPTANARTGRHKKLKHPAKRIETEHLRKGIYILPNLVTTGGMACGFYSIIQSIEGNFVFAAYLIVFASIFDLFDGRVARMTKTTSAFGVQYDSLSDLAAFGVAPGILLHQWGLQEFGRTGWLAAFLFFCCGALRLARFNVQAANPGPAKKFFTGLPIPFAANTVAATIILWGYVFGNVVSHNFFVLLMVFSLAFLMVSTVPYRSFKDFDLKGGRSFQALVCLIILIMLVVSNPPPMLFGIAMAYVASGPLESLYRNTRKASALAVSAAAGRRRRRPTRESE